jgi:ADP-dependent NAD(P)H-hydrate dehydratase / NAD(P)H-hydrate epimerase
VQNMITAPEVTIALTPTELSKLAGPMGIPLPVKGVVASGEARLVFTRGLAQGPVTGQVDARLVGWQPPHPVELDGFLFGNTTTFSSKLTISADRNTVQLSQSRVRASAFDLSGGGRIDRHAAYATIAMSLSGNLPCAAVAQSAAAAHVGSFLAEILGNAAKRVMDGSLSVRVKISADSRHLDEARVEPTVGIGCGLVPVKSLDRSVLQHLPERLQDLANSFPVLPTFDFK